MDINQRVAARREELVRQEREVKAAEHEAVRQRQQAERSQREEALDRIADEITADGVAVKREGEDLALVAPALPPIDETALATTTLKRLLDREARKLWTPGENWQVIASFVAGIFTLPYAGAGLALILIALWRRSVANERCRAVVRERYPALFGDGAVPPPGSLEDTNWEPDAPATKWQKLWSDPHAPDTK